MKEGWFTGLIATIISAALTASLFFGSIGLLIMAFKFFIKMIGGI